MIFVNKISVRLFVCYIALRSSEVILCKKYIRVTKNKRCLNYVDYEVCFAIVI